MSQDDKRLFCHFLFDVRLGVFKLLSFYSSNNLTSKRGDITKLKFLWPVYTIGNISKFLLSLEVYNQLTDRNVHLSI